MTRLFFLFLFFLVTIITSFYFTQNFFPSIKQSHFSTRTHTQKPDLNQTMVKTMKLGSQGLEVSTQGLGCMGMSAFYGTRNKPEEDMIKLIHHAVDSGVTFLDSSDAYGPFTNEVLIGKALKKEGIREKVQLATKFGFKILPTGMQICGEPSYVREACEASLKRLDVDYIDLYYQHRVDTKVPIEVTVKSLVGNKMEHWKYIPEAIDNG